MSTGNGALVIALMKKMTTLGADAVLDVGRCDVSSINLMVKEMSNFVMEGLKIIRCSCNSCECQYNGALTIALIIRRRRHWGSMQC